mgnify:CR=1 FL=1
MRGKVEEIANIFSNYGITPAHAGKSKKYNIRCTKKRDHPRTCGEKTQEVTKYKAYDILHA